MAPTSEPPAEPIGDLTDASPFSQPCRLWRCTGCGGHFAGRRHDLLAPRDVGIFIPTVDLAKNRRINATRRQWQALRAAGSICTCPRDGSLNWLGGWELWDDSDEELAVLLPETRDQARSEHESWIRIYDSDDPDDVDGDDEWDVDE